MHICDRWVDLKNTVLLSQEIIFAQLAGEQMKPILRYNIDKSVQVSR